MKSRTPGDASALGLVGAGDASNNPTPVKPKVRKRNRPNASQLSPKRLAAIRLQNRRNQAKRRARLRAEKLLGKAAAEKAAQEPAPEATTALWDASLAITATPDEEADVQRELHAVYAKISNRQAELEHAVADLHAKTRKHSHMQQFMSACNIALADVRRDLAHGFSGARPSTGSADGVAAGDDASYACTRPLEHALRERLFLLTSLYDCTLCAAKVSENARIACTRAPCKVHSSQPAREASSLNQDKASGSTKDDPLSLTHLGSRLAASGFINESRAGSCGWDGNLGLGSSWETLSGRTGVQADDGAQRADQDSWPKLLAASGAGRQGDRTPALSDGTYSESIRMLYKTVQNPSAGPDENSLKRTSFSELMSELDLLQDWAQPENELDAALLGGKSVMEGNVANKSTNLSGAKHDQFSQPRSNRQQGAGMETRTTHSGSHVPCDTKVLTLHPYAQLGELRQKMRQVATQLLELEWSRASAMPSKALESALMDYCPDAVLEPSQNAALLSQLMAVLRLRGDQCEALAEEWAAWERKRGMNQKRLMWLLSVATSMDLPEGKSHPAYLAAVHEVIGCCQVQRQVLLHLLLAFQHRFLLQTLDDVQRVRYITMTYPFAMDKLAIVLSAFERQQAQAPEKWRASQASQGTLRNGSNRANDASIFSINESLFSMSNDFSLPSHGSGGGMPRAQHSRSASVGAWASTPYTSPRGNPPPAPVSARSSPRPSHRVDSLNAWNTFGDPRMSPRVSPREPQQSVSHSPSLRPGRHQPCADATDSFGFPNPLPAYDDRCTTPMHFSTSSPMMDVEPHWMASDEALPTQQPSRIGAPNAPMYQISSPQGTARRANSRPCPPLDLSHLKQRINNSTLHASSDLAPPECSPGRLPLPQHAAGAMLSPVQPNKGYLAMSVDDAQNPYSHSNYSSGDNTSRSGANTSRSGGNTSRSGANTSRSTQSSTMHASLAQLTHLLADVAGQQEADTTYSSFENTPRDVSMSHEAPMQYGQGDRVLNSYLGAQPMPSAFDTSKLNRQSSLEAAIQKLETSYLPHDSSMHFSRMSSREDSLEQIAALLENTLPRQACHSFM